MQCIKTSAALNRFASETRNAIAVYICVYTFERGRYSNYACECVLFFVARYIIEDTCTYSCVVQAVVRVSNTVERNRNPFEATRRRRRRFFRNSMQRRLTRADLHLTEPCFVISQACTVRQPLGTILLGRSASPCLLRNDACSVTVGR